MKKITFTLIAVVCFLISAQAQFNMKTVAEATDYRSTSRYEDVMQFIRELEKVSPYIRTEIIATTVEGRDIPLMILADPLPESPQDLKNDSRIVVYVQANIHAGEVEGKEAVLMFARDILSQGSHPLFRDVVLLLCPDLNADGNEKISTRNRTNQVGPENGVGVRHNARYLDLNRDAMKVETREMRGVIQNILNRWDPAVVMDMHTTNGVYRQEPVTFSWMINPNGDRELIRYMRDHMMPAISRTLMETYGVENTFYGEFTDMGNPQNGYLNYACEPRYFVNYMGLRNRLAILNENYVYADFRSRVHGSFFLIRSLLDFVSEHRQEIKNMLAAADTRTINKGTDPTPADSFALTYEAMPTPEKLQVKTYEVEPVENPQGWNRYRKTDRPVTLRVPYLADYEPVTRVKYPFAYLITVPDPYVLENLNIHGIQVEKLARPHILQVERFDITELSPSARLNQGHYTNQVKGTFVKETREFPEGTLVVRTAQPLGYVAAYLLEPETDDGLLLWNFFDTYLVPQWGRGYYPYPVYKVLEKEILETGKYH
ncbi:MAG: M14 family metallopeptidase [Bacteroidales bacterium]